ncbi:uncharacterized protein Bfra_004568 [Botrytis fragariae]|uniref:Uncharacterized protein n=1 Tax=Botrytis fragariae TaxID=1964551 RepID=A0A8H6AVU7_9HELO|nr:uncharacterized protein Bfra_004568 [Botrytis fragariae]KAF5874557.1 hypothetical protein Bfra_004568 [Botrytis fragariae]
MSNANPSLESILSSTRDRLDLLSTIQSFFLRNKCQAIWHSVENRDTMYPDPGIICMTKMLKMTEDLKDTALKRMFIYRTSASKIPHLWEEVMRSADEDEDNNQKSEKDIRTGWPRHTPHTLVEGERIHGALGSEVKAFDKVLLQEADIQSHNGMRTLISSEEKEMKPWKRLSDRK